MKDTECKHEYKEVTYMEIEPVIKHWDYKDHLLATLQQERVQIFCIHCGDNKQLTPTPTINN
jgi:hypothetical protein